MRLLIIIVLVTGFLSSCKKDEEAAPNPKISNTPEIEFVKANKTTVTEFEDSLVFTIKYTDGNGDLGYEHADSTSLELIDNRVALVEKYHLGLLAPAGSDIVIQGELSVVLPHTFILDDSASSETTTYSIKVRDRSGNWSNVVNSPTITINK